jgi:hypothetical protein
MLCNLDMLLKLQDLPISQLQEQDYSHLRITALA